MKLRSGTPGKEVKMRGSDTNQINKKMKRQNLPNIEEEVSMAERPRDSEEKSASRAATGAAKRPKSKPKTETKSQSK